MFQDVKGQDSIEMGVLVRELLLAIAERHNRGWKPLPELRADVLAQLYAMILLERKILVSQMRSDAGADLECAEGAVLGQEAERIGLIEVDEHAISFGQNLEPLMHPVVRYSLQFRRKLWNCLRPPEPCVAGHLEVEPRLFHGIPRLVLKSELIPPPPRAKNNYGREHAPLHRAVWIVGIDAAVR